MSQDDENILVVYKPYDASVLIRQVQHSNNDISKRVHFPTEVPSFSVGHHQISGEIFIDICISGQVEQLVSLPLKAFVSTFAYSISVLINESIRGFAATQQLLQHNINALQIVF